MASVDVALEARGAVGAVGDEVQAGGGAAAAHRRSVAVQATRQAVGAPSAILDLQTQSIGEAEERVLLAVIDARRAGVVHREGAGVHPWPIPLREQGVQRRQLQLREPSADRLELLQAIAASGDQLDHAGSTNLALEAIEGSLVPVVITGQGERCPTAIEPETQFRILAPQVLEDADGEVRIIAR